jgi:hypothetical protein
MNMMHPCKGAVREKSNLPGVCTLKGPHERTFKLYLGYISSVKMKYSKLVYARCWVRQAKGLLCFKEITVELRHANTTTHAGTHRHMHARGRQHPNIYLVEIYIYFYLPYICKYA